MIRKIVLAAFVVAASGCATWTPEQRQAFIEGMNAGSNAWKQGQQSVQPYQSKYTHCTSRKSFDGKSIETDCY